MPQTPPPPATNLKELFSFRLNVLAHLSSKLAAHVNREDFGLDPREWRIVALLGAFAPLSPLALARELDIDKSQASRMIAGLIERGLLQRHADENDGRGVQLTLTAEGKALYRKVFPKALKRNETLRSVLSPEEQLQLDDMLQRLTAHAVQMLEAARTPKTRKPRAP
jgi:DNA-binding MarR family transcriptional regulator